jgi:hypothetical protein
MTNREQSGDKYDGYEASMQQSRPGERAMKDKLIKRQWVAWEATGLLREMYGNWPRKTDDAACDAAVEFANRLTSRILYDDLHAKYGIRNHKRLHEPLAIEGGKLPKLKACHFCKFEVIVGRKKCPA